MHGTMSQTNASPLTVTVTVTGSINVSGILPIAGASLNYYLINSTGQKYPKFYPPLTGTACTNAAGSAVLTFSSVNAGKCAYVLIVYANLRGLSGVGYFVGGPAVANKIIPVVGSFSDGKGNATILLERQSSNTLYFNTTFLALGSSISSVVQVSIRNGTVNLPTVTGLVNNNNPFASIQIPNDNQTGVLVVTYNSTATAPGISLLPWGISSLGVSIVFGSAIPSSSNNGWVTTDVRQVMVAGESYELKIALWSLAGIQAQGSSGGASI
jgi:hypothetical protein